MRSTEVAHLIIISPKGGKVSLYKGAFGNKEHFKKVAEFSAELKNRLLQGIGKCKVNLTSAEMSKLLEISKTIR